MGMYPSRGQTDCLTPLFTLVIKPENPQNISKTIPSRKTDMRKKHWPLESKHKYHTKVSKIRGGNKTTIIFLQKIPERNSTGTLPERVGPYYLFHCSSVAGVCVLCLSYPVRWHDIAKWREPKPWQYRAVKGGAWTHIYTTSNRETPPLRMHLGIVEDSKLRRMCWMSLGIQKSGEHSQLLAHSRLKERLNVSYMLYNTNSNLKRHL